MLGLGVFDDVPENQFTFAPCVARIDNEVDVLSLEQLRQNPQAAFSLLNRFEIEMWWNDRKAFERPFATRCLDTFRRDNGRRRRRLRIGRSRRNLPVS
jgi:hypothetical protein